MISNLIVYNFYSSKRAVATEKEILFYFLKNPE
jgi:hypothetical protein